MAAAVVERHEQQGRGHAAAGTEGDGHTGEPTALAMAYNGVCQALDFNRATLAHAEPDAIALLLC